MAVELDRIPGSHPRLVAAIVVGTAVFVLGALVARTGRPLWGLRLLVFGGAIAIFGAAGYVAFEIQRWIDESNR